MGRQDSWGMADGALGGRKLTYGAASRNLKCRPELALRVPVSEVPYFPPDRSNAGAGPNGVDM